MALRRIEQLALGVHQRCVEEQEPFRTSLQEQPMKTGQDRLTRIQLVSRVQAAYEQMKDTMQRYHDDSPRARAAIAAARRRFSTLNRALAMLTLESMQQTA
jgi:hypothetical protein